MKQKPDRNSLSSVADDPSSPPAVVSYSTEDPDEVIRYWTPERIASAQPVMPTVRYPDDESLRPVLSETPEGLEQHWSPPSGPADPD